MQLSIDSGSDSVAPITSVSRDGLAKVSRASFEGVAVGLFREGDDLIPIPAQNSEAERIAATSNFEQLQISGHC